jgi:hypothetical protein
VGAAEERKNSVTVIVANWLLELPDDTKEKNAKQSPNITFLICNGLLLLI